MSDIDHEYFHRIMVKLERIAEPKFMAGVKEHKSHIWDLTDEELEWSELEEIIDWVMYRMTRLLKKEDSRPPK